MGVEAQSEFGRRNAVGNVPTILEGGSVMAEVRHCLLYTSDAADERSSVDLGGRRIIKKTNRVATHCDCYATH